jgi:hypothetical protein
MSKFDFQAAQSYEFDYAKQWMEQQSPAIFNDIDEMRSAGIPKAHYSTLFFQDNNDIWEDFQGYVKDKNCLEISSGPCGIFPLWGHWITGKKTIIDPLILQYEAFLTEKFSRTWFLPEVQKLPLGAENFVEQLNDTIDGFILWRNGIDHFENWRDAIENMSRYAKPGCFLLFWGDLIHIDQVDQGHMQKVVDSIPEFEAILLQHGWEIQYRTPAQRDHKREIDYGCVAIKGGKVAQQAVFQGSNTANQASADQQAADNDIPNASIAAFLRNLSPAGRGYLLNCLQYCHSVNKMVEKYEITKEELCIALELKDHEYDDFISGAWNYSLRDMSKMDSLLYKKRLQFKMAESQKEGGLTAFPEYKYSKTTAEKSE